MEAKEKEEEAVEMEEAEEGGRAASTTHRSVHTDHIKEVHDMPMAVITRGLESVLDEQKVQSLMGTLQDAAQAENVPPIDVLWIQGSKNPQNNYYFAFGGCHRYEAHRRLKKDTIPAKIMKGTRSDLMVYLGSFAPLCE